VTEVVQWINSYSVSLLAAFRNAFKSLYIELFVPLTFLKQLATKFTKGAFENEQLSQL
jgi:hypothetical protein